MRELERGVWCDDKENEPFYTVFWGPPAERPFLTNPTTTVGRRTRPYRGSSSRGMAGRAASSEWLHLAGSQSTILKFGGSGGSSRSSRSDWRLIEAQLPMVLNIFTSLY